RPFRSPTLLRCPTRCKVPDRRGNLRGAAQSNAGREWGHRDGRHPSREGDDEMIRRTLLAAAAFALTLSGAALAQAAKPNDAQIAHIAYTAGVIDIATAKQALKKSHNKQVLDFA